MSDRAGDAVPSLVPITPRKRVSQEILVGTANMIVGIVPLPIFIAPIEDESARANLVALGGNVGLDGVPFRG